MTFTISFGITASKASLCYTCPMPRLGIREQHKRDRREAIYQAAIELFDAHGFANTTVVDIAKAAEVSRGTVFNYYAYKEAILLEYFRHDFASLHRFTELDIPPLQALWQVLDAVTEIIQAKHALMVPVAQELMHHEPARSQAALRALPLDKIFLELLAAARMSGKVRSDFSLERLARTLTNMYFITALQWSIYHQTRPLKEEIDKAMTIAIEGILS